MKSAMSSPFTSIRSRHDHRIGPPDGIAIIRRILLGAWFIQLSMSTLSADTAAPKGQSLYQSRCAECHGANGEGIPTKYSQPLTGDLSQVDLANLIHETMPPDPRPKCSSEEAQQIAEFIFTAFYSPKDNAAHSIPRIELRHLTARQYRYAIADLMTS